MPSVRITTDWGHRDRMEWAGAPSISKEGPLVSRSASRSGFRALSALPVLFVSATVSDSASNGVSRPHESPREVFSPDPYGSKVLRRRRVFSDRQCRAGLFSR